MFVNNAGINTGLAATVATYTPTSVKDWYSEKTLNLENSTIFWSTIAPKPVTNQYTKARGGEGDALHVVVVDDYGVVTGIQGNIIEKHVSLSKAEDSISAVISPL